MKKYYIVFILLFSMLSACKKGSYSGADLSKDPIVTVLDKTLYRTDLEGLTYYGMTKEDSIAATQAYIKLWINDILLYDKAKKNVSDRWKVDELVEEYRRSLIMNNYQTQLLRERLSKTVKDEELSEYYTNNKDKFKLKEDIIQGLYLKIPKESRELDNFRKWYRQNNEASIKHIEENILQNAVAYENFYNKWVSFDDVINNIPEIIIDNKAFLRSNKAIEASDSSFVYFLQIGNYKLTGDDAPFEYIKDFVSEIYSEEKRNSYIRELQSDLYNKALSNKKILYYTNNKETN